MATQIVIPNIGESVTSGVIAAWTVADGAYVERDQTVLELETDKITMEVPAPAAGIIKHTASEGDEVGVGAVVGSIDESAEAPAASEAEKPAAKTEAKTEAKSEAKASAPANAGGGSSASSPAASTSATKQAADNGAASSNGQHATPLAMRIATERDVDLQRVTGTGPGGRIREQDVLAFVQARGMSPATGTTPSSNTSDKPRASREVTVERMSPMRQSIAARLVEAQHTAAMLTTFNEVDMKPVMDLRKRLKEGFAERHDVNLGFMSFFVKAAVAALRAFPMVNAYIVADEKGKPAVQKHAYQDVAIAVASPKGLVVPVLRNAHGKSFADIESEIKEFATRAKAGKLSLEEMQGGTFTITNGGVFGSLLSTPILNPPQSAILGMHGIKNRAVENPDKPGEIVLRPMMYLALSYDHRIVDGAEAVQFLVHIKSAIEDPARLLLEL